MGIDTLIRIVLLLAVSSAAFLPIAAAKNITLAYQTPTLSSNLPIFAANELGLFRAENLEVKTVFIQGGPTAMAALIGGDVDYVKVAGIPAARAIAFGAPVVIAGGFQPYIDYSLIGSKKLVKLDDLRGKIVGVTGAGGIAEFATVEGLARKGFTRDRDYRILYGVGNSPARAHALETDKIQASPFSFTEKLELERKGFPLLFDIGKVVPRFPFSVLLTTRRKAETAPDEIRSLLRVLKRAMETIRSEKEKVLATVLKKRSYEDPTIARKLIEQFSEYYSVAITQEDIESLIASARLEAEARKIGGVEKFYLGPLVNRILTER
ncbi:MAG TPA: ABC transporter substrate-binding protein [Candidatus Binatia bacterium]|jgi:ABC-type nitrate/sulfonate/bicarbonate transport system substrate-binding protein